MGEDIKGVEKVVDKYKTFEEQIEELWASRGMEILEEHFTSLGRGRFKWTIFARKGERK